MYFQEYLEPCPGYGWEGGPEFSTRIVALANGRERRNGNWQMPRHKYSAPFLNISKDAYREIKRMFLACSGQLHCFRFRDELDYEAVDQKFGVGDGIERDFQLSTVSEVDGVSYLRSVYAIASVQEVSVNGSAADPEGYVIDMDRGVVRFDSAPPAGATLSWTGTFDVWVRFNQDYLPFSLDNPNATNGSVEVIEVPPPTLLES